MCISSLEAEKLIKDYYVDKRKIEHLQSRINMLKRQLQDVINDIDNSNITLLVHIPSIDYSRDKIQVSYSGSEQENEIERAFRTLEKQKQLIETEILEMKTEIRELEKDTYDIDYIISMLIPQAKLFVELKYLKRKSNNYISRELHMSESSVSRLRELVLKDISNWIYPFHKKMVEKRGKSGAKVTENW